MSDKLRDLIPRRLRFLLYEQIDRLDTYCLEHAWVPVWARMRVGRVWQWTFKDNITLTAVGDDSPFYGVDTEKCYISGCGCGRPKYERQSGD